MPDKAYIKNIIENILNYQKLKFITEFQHTMM